VHCFHTHGTHEGNLRDGRRRSQRKRRRRRGKKRGRRRRRRRRRERGKDVVVCLSTIYFEVYSVYNKKPSKLLLYLRTTRYPSTE
jgi:hypothetical protein